MALEVIVDDGNNRAEFRFPTPPASNDGDGHGKRAGDARHGGGDSEDDGCAGCRKIAQNEVWNLQRQENTMGELYSFLVRLL